MHRRIHHHHHHAGVAVEHSAATAAAGRGTRITTTTTRTTSSSTTATSSSDTTARKKQQQQQHTIPTPSSNDKTTTSTSRPTRRKMIRRRNTTKPSFLDNFLNNVPFLICAVVLLFIAVIVGLFIVWNLFQSRKHHFGFFSNDDKVEIINRYSNPKNPHLKSNLNDGDVTEPQPSFFPPLKESDLYVIPNSMSHIGDKSNEYAKLRKKYDTEIYPYDTKRSLNVVSQLRQTNNYEVYDNPIGYDINNCPMEPPINYPYEWSTLTIIKNWNPHNTNIPKKIYQGICIFDYTNDYIKILNYRYNEVPYIVRDDPSVAQTVERWNTQSYMDDLLGDILHRTEYSTNNHFLYWMPSKDRNPKSPIVDKKKIPENWKEPTTMLRMSYKEWLSHASTSPDQQQKISPDQPHWYFRLIGCGETEPTGTCDNGSSEYLFDELPFFQPRPDRLYLVEHDKQKGIHCRFGMEGVIAENHFDASRNSIVLLKGQRRYILSSPKQCRNLALFPKGHPSARHSSIDWSNPNLDENPEFGDAKSNEVILEPGDVLYLPTNWFHFIVSLNLNYQCNTRSGTSNEYWEPIHRCGF